MVKNKLNLSFTLIELLITVTIIFIFSGLTLSYYNNFTQEQQLKNEAKKFVDVLELAKKKAISGDQSNQTCNDFNGYRISASPTTYQLSLCCNGDCSNNISINTYALENNVTFENNLTFQFLPLARGVTSLISTFPITICMKNNIINKFNKITVEKTGIINLDTNLTDSCL